MGTCAYATGLRTARTWLAEDVGGDVGGAARWQIARVAKDVVGEIDHVMAERAPQVAEEAIHYEAPEGRGDGDGGGHGEALARA